MRSARNALLLAALAALAACAHPRPAPPRPAEPATDRPSSRRGPESTRPAEPPPAAVRPVPRPTAQEGLASFYARMLHGRRTASGVRYDEQAMTAAHRTLPFGTRVRVTELAGGRSVVVTVNDRGPFVKGRVIDLSRAAARRLGILQAGVVRVRVEPLAEQTAER